MNVLKIELPKLEEDPKRALKTLWNYLQELQDQIDYNLTALKKKEDEE